MPSSESGHSKSGHNEHGSSNKSRKEDKEGRSSDIPSRKGGENGTQGKQDDTTVEIYLTIFIFRGAPDVWYKRHVVICFTSPDLPYFYKSVHAQRADEQSPWSVTLMDGKIRWEDDATYKGHVNAGCVTVCKGQEMVPVTAVASVPVEGREQQSDWNCQNFVYEGLLEIVGLGLRDDEWYIDVQGEIMNELLDQTVG